MTEKEESHRFGVARMFGVASSERLQVIGLCCAVSVVYITALTIKSPNTWTNALLGSFGFGIALVNVLGQFASIENELTRIDLKFAAREAGLASCWFGMCIAWWYTFLPEPVETNTLWTFVFPPPAIEPSSIHWAITRAFWTFGVYLLTRSGIKLLAYCRGQDLSQTE